MVGFGQVVLVSSATSQEGKSATTASLAAAACAAGRRVLVVDCDLRAPTLHTAFNLDLTPGVAECVEGAVEYDSALQYHPDTGVWLLSAGNTYEAPQRLLHSAAMARLLSQLRDSFDLVLLDTPPVLAVSDVRTLAPVADHTMLIVAWSRTEWAASKLALRMLREAGAQIVGAVLSRVDVAQLARFELPEAQIYGKPYSKYRRVYRTRPSPRCYAEAEA